MVKSAIAQSYEENGLPVAGLLGVGVSVSGPVSRDGVVLRASMVPTWAGVNIRDVFGPVLEQPIFADNESNCSAIAELMWGAAVGHDDFVLFKIDLGVGGAIVQHGRLVTGIAGGAGEFGHISIDPGGDLCRCGNRGCLELYASFTRPLEQISRVVRRQVTMDDVITMAEAGRRQGVADDRGYRRDRRPGSRPDRLGAQSAADHHRRPHGFGRRHSVDAADRVL